MRFERALASSLLVCAGALAACAQSPIAPTAADGGAGAAGRANAGDGGAAGGAESVDAGDDTTAVAELASACVAFRDELRVIQSCQSSDQCGQVLAETSCGCTRNLVATNAADTQRFFELQMQIDMLIHEVKTFPDVCSGPGFGSTCDCPATQGFACVDGLCTWNYTQ